MSWSVSSFSSFWKQSVHSCLEHQNQRLLSLVVLVLGLSQTVSLRKLILQVNLMMQEECSYLKSNKPLKLNNSNNKQINSEQWSAWKRTKHKFEPCLSKHSLNTSTRFALQEYCHDLRTYVKFQLKLEKFRLNFSSLIQQIQSGIDQWNQPHLDLS